MSRILVTALVIMSACLACQASEKPDLTPVSRLEKDAPRIDVVFVLDTTGSMGGLIAGAKEKIWSIASMMATGTPTPQIRMGLIGYRDRGDAYVTVLTPLTEDLDALHATLMGFKADGGGDSPESVNQALDEAVTKMDWAQDEKTYRAIFLVGDCPPHMDYPDDVKYPVTCKLAASRGIVINTIQCGNYGETAPIWQDIAKRADGSYSQVQQSGGAVAIVTPVDAEMVRVSQELDATRLYWGDATVQAANAERKVKADSLYADAPTSSLASRAGYQVTKSGAANFLGVQELVDDVVNNRVQIETLSEDQLPEELKAMTPEERKATIEAKAKDRAALQVKLTELKEQREDFIKKEREAAPAAADAFDEKIRGDIAEQAKARADIEYAP